MSDIKFEDLTWEDLNAWAGSRVVARGKSYRGNVEDLCVTADGRLLAWVNGSEQYATAVSLPQKGKPDSVCTCPYGTACKHAVATILVYLEAVKARKAYPSQRPMTSAWKSLRTLMTLRMTTMWMRSRLRHDGQRKKTWWMSI